MRLLQGIFLWAACFHISYFQFFLRIRIFMNFITERTFQDPNRCRSISQYFLGSTIMEQDHNSKLYTCIANVNLFWKTYTVDR